MNRALHSHVLPASVRGVLLLLVLVVLLPLLAVQAGVYAVWHHTRWTEQENATLETAQEAAATFDAYIHDVRRQQSAMIVALAGTRHYTSEETNAFLTASGQDYPSIRSWSLTDSEGKIIASTQLQALGLKIGDRSYFRELHGGRRWTVSNLLTDRVNGGPIFIIASRMDGRNGAFNGAMVAVAKIGDLGQHAVAIYRPVGEAIALFDRNGVLVYNSQESHDLFHDWRAKDPLLTRAIATGETQLDVLTLTNEQGVRESQFAARVPLQDIGWVAGARRSVAKAMAKVYAALWIAGGANLLVAAGSGALALAVGDSFIRQLRRLQSHVEAIGRGEFERGVKSDGAGELADLANAFTRMGAAVCHARQSLEAANASLQQEVVERQHTADQLARSNEELEYFAYIASHDLQEPLRVVVGYVQLIERRYKNKLDADADQFIQYIIEGVARMQQLITDLLNYSRVGTRGKPFQTTDLRKVMARVVANLQKSVEESGATVAYDSLPSVQGDETQLVQLFQNMVGNGIKFHGERPPQIDVSARRDGDRWEIAVRDNGIGIERQYWDKIFVIFQRLHTRQKYPGTGIGLALCKRIVERHGGRIWLDSQLGQGTTFYFTLS